MYMIISRQTFVGLHEYSDWGDPYSDRTQAVKYMVSHDEQSILQEMVTFNNYSIEEARERDKFYATVLFTSLGIPMLFQGQEFGLQTGWDDDNNKLTAAAVAAEDMAEWSKYLTLQYIFEGLSNSMDDIFHEKGLRYRALAETAASRAVLRLDIDGDGSTDEKVNNFTGLLLRR